MIKSNKKIHYYSIIHFFERFSFYGLRSLLFLFFITNFDYSDEKTYVLVGIFGTLTYLTPLLGGYISDKFLSCEISVFIGLLFLFLGYLIILLSLFNFIFIGLALLVIGSGFYQPSIKVLMGELCNSHNLSEESGFTILYIYQNLGAFLSPLLCGYLGIYIKWHYGFTLILISSIFSFLTMYFLQERKNKFKHNIVFVKNNIAIIIAILSFVSLILSMVIFYAEYFLNVFLFISIAILVYFAKFYLSANADQKKNIFIIYLSILLISVSGALLNHGAGVFTLFMKRNVNNSFLNFEIPINTIQSVDSLSLIVIGFLLGTLFKKNKYDFSVLNTFQKMIFGFAIIFISYVMIYLLCICSKDSDAVSFLPFYIILFILSGSDIFIYPNALTLCSKLSPRNLKGIIMGGVVFGMSISYLLGTYLSKMASIPKNTQAISPSESFDIYMMFFAKMAIISFVILFVLYLVKKLYEKHLYGSE